MDKLILNQHAYIVAEEIRKGWSEERKYRAINEMGQSVLLRFTSKEKHKQKYLEYEMMQKAASLNIPMCNTIDIGIVGDDSVTVQTWIDGDDAEEVIPTLSDTEQYVLGMEAGRCLRRLHTIPAPENQEPWMPRFNRKLDRKLELYHQCPLKYENGELFIHYIGANRHLLHDRPQSFQHGDFHIGNMMIDRDGRLYIIDFNRFDFGDPWEEFNRIVWCAQKAPLFATGIVNGYFDCRVPEEFWRLLALYIASNTLSSLPWAIPFGNTEIETMRRQASEVLAWYHNMQNPLPTWYRDVYYLQEFDGIPFKMSASFDFSPLKKYGRVFKIFDDQDSGNICFGFEKDGERFFVKFAGAPTEQYNGAPHDAVARLKSSVPVYNALRHKNLIEYIASEEIADGFAMIFKWSNGNCMGRMYPAAHTAFMALPIEKKLAVFTDISRFFAHIAKEGWLAVDFYDGSILYDPATDKTTICDIDFFRRSPSVNDMGRMWGSSHFQSPEEYEYGAVLDEVTNVYTLGATAFALFGEYNRTRKKWQLSDKLFEIATKAVSDDRAQRQQSIQQLTEEWEAAL